MCYQVVLTAEYIFTCSDFDSHISTIRRSRYDALRHDTSKYTPLHWHITFLLTEVTSQRIIRQTKPSHLKAKKCIAHQYHTMYQGCVSRAMPLTSATAIGSKRHAFLSTLHEAPSRKKYVERTRPPPHDTAHHALQSHVSCTVCSVRRRCQTLKSK